MIGDEPSLRQRWLGNRLAELRHDTGFSLQEASRRAERSTASLSRIENGLVALPPRDVRPLLEAYNVTDTDLRETLIAVAGEVQAERRGWWVEHDDGLSPSYLDLVRLEATATRISTFEVGVLPGLLQHEGYARAAVQATSGTALSDSELDQFVSVRKQRQQILVRDEDPVAFHAVVHEALLHQRLGGSDVFTAQLEHLLECTKRPNITVQVLPLATSAHPALVGAFTVLGMSRLEFVHVELMTSDVYIEDTVGVQRYQDAFTALSDLALSPDESARLIVDKIDIAT
ncbi:transcriptional regulator with XRE-family HTH domain [Spinactinospora alkalitolerans]|uniref:Transcriptional regulator with XRE-family HTH domain n=1 Tax=Spinactinospora alkalitolerans TaxID=687207 RepID=A0A852U4L9_9ACTN|nr:helix-turn-helix transcriptional regulator [Spinactinospora alkalitolerans]NYE50442.1 transcriptional regulator with XRE-family HTH domain [Spinactinospora alkalitolerans]